MIARQVSLARNRLPRSSFSVVALEFLPFFVVHHLVYVESSVNISTSPYEDPT